MMWWEIDQQPPNQPTAWETDVLSTKLLRQDRIIRNKDYNMFASQKGTYKHEKSKYFIH